MKDQMISNLRSLEERIRALRAKLKKLKIKAVSQKSLRAEAESLADVWVEDLRSPLEHRFKINSSTISKYADEFKKLHVLSRPNNLVKSYIECLSRLLKDFKDDLILPIQQASEPASGNSQLHDIIDKIPEADVSDYLNEAVYCADSGYARAAIVMGWCSAVDHIHNKLVMIGLDKLNTVSTKLKQQTKGRFQRFNKEFKITTLNELQEVFDTDLLWILEGMELIDSNEGDRLRVCFQYRNHSAHPGDAPIGDVHLITFFSDIVDIVLTNPKLSLTGGSRTK